LMRDYFVLLTDLPLADIDALLAGHPRDAKARLATEIVACYHGAKAAQQAAAEFDKVFRQGELPDDMPTYTLRPDDLEDGAIWIVRLVAASGMASSNGAARRLVQQGGVSLDGARIDDLEARIAIAGGEILRVGKRKFARLQPPAAE
ncbi:tyrosine--tRNA ligase, partial [bacterium]|nr:tyrosine--tRNA ligase [bacterium]